MQSFLSIDGRRIRALSAAEATGEAMVAFWAVTESTGDELWKIEVLKGIEWEEMGGGGQNNQGKR